jgi:methylmalonyl-CoA mutase
MDFERWRALVDKALKGAPFDSLTSLSDDGIALDPLYAPAHEAGRLPCAGVAAPGLWRSGLIIPMRSGLRSGHGRA